MIKGNCVWEWAPVCQTWYNRVHVSEYPSKTSARFVLNLASLLLCKEQKHSISVSLLCKVPYCRCKYRFTSLLMIPAHIQSQMFTLYLIENMLMCKCAAWAWRGSNTGTMTTEFKKKKQNKTLQHHKFSQRIIKSHVLDISRVSLPCCLVVAHDHISAHTRGQLFSLQL